MVAWWLGPRATAGRARRTRLAYADVRIEIVPRINRAAEDRGRHHTPALDAMHRDRTLRYWSAMLPRPQDHLPRTLRSAPREGGHDPTDLSRGILEQNAVPASVQKTGSLANHHRRQATPGA